LTKNGVDRSETSGRLILRARDRMIMLFAKGNKIEERYKAINCCLTDNIWNNCILCLNANFCALFNCAHSNAVSRCVLLSCHSSKI